MKSNKIKLLTHNLNELKFNTSLSRLMEFVNYFNQKGLNDETKSVYIRLLAPLAPHLSEELWSKFNKDSVFIEEWPKYKEEYLIIQEALNLLDDFTQNVKGDFLKAIKIREIIHDLKEAEIRRFK